MILGFVMMAAPQPEPYVRYAEKQSGLGFLALAIAALLMAAQVNLFAKHRATLAPFFEPAAIGLIAP